MYDALKTLTHCPRTLLAGGAPAPGQAIQDWFSSGFREVRHDVRIIQAQCRRRHCAHHARSGRAQIHRIAALGLVTQVQLDFDAEADRLAKAWLEKYTTIIKGLSHDRQESYRQIREMSAEPQSGANQEVKEQSLSLEEALSLGVDLHRSGRLPEAETIYRRVLEACPDQPDAWHYLGLLAHQRGEREQAVTLIRKAIVLAPGHVDAHNNLGNVFKEQGSPAEAEACFLRVIDLVPDHASAYNNLGVALKEQGKLDAAVAAYQKAILLRPDYFDAHYNLGNAFFNLENLENALAAYQAVVALQPNHLEGHHSLGRLYERQGKAKEADLTAADLADGFFIGNIVRGLIPATLVDQAA